MIIIDINGSERNCSSVRLDKSWPGYFKIHFKNERRSYDQWYPISDFVKNNPKLDHLAEGGINPPEEVVGVVTKSQEMTLTDSNQNWKKNLFAGVPVWISRGKGEGQVRAVIFNNKDTLTVDKEWEVLPDETSQFIISYNVHNPQAPGNTLAQVEVSSLVKPINKTGGKKKKI